MIQAVSFGALAIALDIDGRFVAISVTVRGTGRGGSSGIGERAGGRRFVIRVPLCHVRDGPKGGGCRRRRPCSVHASARA